jgi:hypothetical protein
VEHCGHFFFLKPENGCLIKKENTCDESKQICLKILVPKTFVHSLEIIVLTPKFLFTPKTKTIKELLSGTKTEGKKKKKLDFCT